MSFKDWKSRSRSFVNAWGNDERLYLRIERACAGAYKAGKRQGWKDTEKVAWIKSKEKQK